MVFVGDSLDARSELEWLKETAACTERLQSGAAQLVGDEFGRELAARRPGQATFERLGRQVADFAAQVFNADLRDVATGGSRWNTIGRGRDDIFLAGGYWQRVRRAAAAGGSLDGGQRRLLGPVRQIGLRRAVGRAGRPPAKLLTVGR